MQVATNNFFAQLEEAEESAIMPDLFSDDELESTPALEALEDDLNRLGEVDGTAEAESGDTTNITRLCHHWPCC